MKSYIVVYERTASPFLMSWCRSKVQRRQRENTRCLQSFIRNKKIVGVWSCCLVCCALLCFLKMNEGAFTTESTFPQPLIMSVVSFLTRASVYIKNAVKRIPLQNQSNFVCCFTYTEHRNNSKIPHT